MMIKIVKFKIKLLIGLIFILAIISSCKNDNELTFLLKGNVYDQTFEQGLSGGKVNVYTVSPESLSSTLVETENISSNGSYEVEIKRGLYNSVIIEIEKENYFIQKIDVPFSDLKPNEDNVYDFSVYAKSWVVFNIKNQSSPSESDELKFLKAYGKEGCDECCSNGFSFYYGVTDFEKVCPNNGNDGFSYKYWVNGNEFFLEDSITTPVFDTVSIDIFY